MAFREITVADVPALFDVRPRTRENALTVEELHRLGINPRSVALRAYGFYRKRGWSDWKIERGMRWMEVTLEPPA